MKTIFKLTIPQIETLPWHKAHALSGERGGSVEEIQRGDRISRIAAHFETDAVTAEKLIALIETRDGLARTIHIGKDQFSAMTELHAHRWGDVSAGVITPSELVSHFTQQVAVDYAQKDFESWLSETEKAFEAASNAVDKFASDNRIKAK